MSFPTVLQRGPAGELHGFVLTSEGAQQCTLSYDVGTRTVTVTPTGATTPIYVDGTLYEKPAISLAHPDASGEYLFYLDHAGALQVSAGFPALDWTQFQHVALVVFTKVGGDKGILLDERHGWQRNLNWHRWAHYEQGTVLVSGLEIDPATYTLNSDSDAAVTPGFFAGIIADEDIRSTITAKAQGSYLIFRRSGAYWTWETSTMPFPVVDTYPAWDNAGTPTALSGVSLGEWMNVWVFAVPAIADGEQLICVPGHAKFTTLAAAQAETVGSLSGASIPFIELSPVCQLTFRARSIYGGTNHARLVSVLRLKGTKSIITATGTQNASTTPYTPTTPADWPAGVPASVGAALDDLAARLAALP